MAIDSDSTQEDSGEITATSIQLFASATAVTGFKKQGNIPQDFTVLQNYPNPFNPVTRIDFTLPETQKVVLKIYNMLGELVREIINKETDAGRYSIKFNSTGLASGVYIYRLETSAYVASRKMMLLK